MNVLFDASWLANYKVGTTMHGGLRVTFELAKRLSQSNMLDLSFTLTDLNNGRNTRLKNFVSEQFGISANKVITNDALPLQVFLRLLKLLGTDSGMRFINKKYSFIQSSQLNQFNIYHSPVDAIPNIVKQNKKVKPFLTALDLIALVRPDLAYPGFYDYLYTIYNSIDENTIVLCISESTKNDLLNYRKDLKEEQVLVTYIAADTNVFYRTLDMEIAEPILKKYGLEKHNYFFMLSAMAKFKNTNHTIHCFLKYVTAFKNTEVKLMVVGTSREKDYDVGIYSKYKSHPQIIFIDFLPEEELSVVYSNATAFLYMSLYEGFGLPILEAMQCGTPVISSNTSSMPEVIGDAGICISPTDEDLLCDAMHTMYTSDDKRKLFSDLGLQRAKMFSWEKYAADVINAYQKFA